MPLGSLWYLDAEILTLSQKLYMGLDVVMESYANALHAPLIKIEVGSDCGPTLHPK